MSRFAGVPEIPASLDEWEFRTLSALKQNIELLAGTRGEIDGSSRAVIRSDISVRPPGTPQFQALSARGNGVSIASVSVPTADDYAALLGDFVRLSQDVAVLRVTLTILINQLRGS